MNNRNRAAEASLRRMRAEASYRTALSKYRQQRGLTSFPWITCLIIIGTVFLWCLTTYQAALLSGARDLPSVFTYLVRNAVDVRPQDNDTLSNVLIQYGAKDNNLIQHGQYWRFVTPTFLHVNLLHISLNMLNLLVIGIFLERIMGPGRFLLTYIVTGTISLIASFYFAPQDISVGASGAIFGLVGAYSIFILAHRRAFRYGGIPAAGWLIFVIGINLSIGLFVSNVDNSAHIGGLLSGFLFGWWFTPLYKETQTEGFIDVHTLKRRWHLALLTVLGTLVLAIIALHLST